MDKAIPRVLKSIVQTHGLAFTQSQNLCKAYLADLMPNFAEERQQLIAAVAYDLPRKLLETQTRQQHKALALDFGKASSLAPTQALQVVDTWFYVLQGTTYSPPHSTWFYSRNWFSYLGGLLTGFLILLLGTAIAVYKKPENTIPTQEFIEKTSARASVASSLPPSNTPINLSSSPKNIRLLHSDQAPESLRLLPPLVPQWTKLDDLASEQVAQQTLLPILFEHQYKTPSQSLEAAPANTPANTTKIAQAHKKADTNTLAETKVLPHKPNQPLTKKSLAPIAKKPQIDLKKRQAEIQSLFNSNAQSMQVLVEQILGLRKKQNEQQALNELFKLTSDRFYSEPLIELDQQIRALNLRIDHLSAAYSKQVTQLCEQAPDAWQDKEFTTKKTYAKQIQILVLKHWQTCKTLSSQQIRQQVLSQY